MSDRISLPKDRIRVLLLEGISDSAVELLAAAGYANVTRLPKALDGPALAEALAGRAYARHPLPHPAHRRRRWRPPTG